MDMEGGMGKKVEGGAGLGTATPEVGELLGGREFGAGSKMVEDNGQLGPLLVQAAAQLARKREALGPDKVPKGPDT